MRGRRHGGWDAHTEVGTLRCYVENGLAGCELAREHDALVVVVDALRASAMLASLFHYGAERVLVVRAVEEAFAQRDRRPGAILAGERGGPMVPGFDLGNSPLQAPPGLDVRQVVFSSSNCSRCCVGVAGGRPAFVASTVNATAAAALLGQAVDSPERELVVVTAGAAAHESLLTLEDHLAAGVILEALEGHGVAVECANDRALVCRRLLGGREGATVQERLQEGFAASRNGQSLRRLGLGADVEFAARLDVFAQVPRVAETVALGGGGQGALLVL
jgi:2-phosphosulfolactate phosphatase